MTDDRGAAHDIKIASLFFHAPHFYPPPLIQQQLHTVLHTLSIMSYNAYPPPNREFIINLK